jgi:hypothetical protein
LDGRGSYGKDLHCRKAAAVIGNFLLSDVAGGYIPGCLPGSKCDGSRETAQTTLSLPTPVPPSTWWRSASPPPERRCPRQLS